jgi:hypothetical protein
MSRYASNTDINIKERNTHTESYFVVSGVRRRGHTHCSLSFSNSLSIY